VSLVRLEIATREPYLALVGRGALAEVAASLPRGERCALVGDRTALELHAERLVGLEDPPTLAVAPGEGSKSLAELERVLGFLAGAGLDRRSVLVVLGGGVVGDLGGLAASLYMRGIGVVQCPTTLVAQVDAAVGGKTAVNLERGKNLAGTFHQPRAVFADTETLATLRDEDYRCGLGEVVKTALVGDGELLARIEEHADDLADRRADRADRDPDLLADVVVRCVRVKGALVARDVRDVRERKRLNLGHTFAHAIEHAAGYGTIPHGEAVAVGLGLALAASERLGVLRDPELPARIERLLGRLGLPASLDELRERYGASLAPEEIAAGMRHDKKGRAGAAALVLPESVGRIRTDCPADGRLLAEVLGAE